MKTARRLQSFPEYVFSKLLKEAKEVEIKTGRKLLNLAVGSPDIKPSEQYLAKLNEFIKQKQSYLYPGYGACPELSKAIRHWHCSRFSTELKSDEFFPVNGGKDAIAHISMALLDGGDEVLVPDPGYPSFAGSALLLNAKPVPYPLLKKNNYKPDLKTLIKLITERTKFIWINFPSNPTGAVADLNELETYVEFAKKHKIWLVYDNAYSEITFGGFIAPSILEVPGAKEVSLEVHSFSKSFSFAGFRMGWIAGNKELVSAAAKVKSQVDSGMSWALQMLGAEALLNTDRKWEKEMQQNYANRQQTMARYFKQEGLEFDIPQGSLYLWAKIPKNFPDSASYAKYLLYKRQILLTPGTAFGSLGEGYVRISICSDISNISDYFIK